jgi:GNAT superfamily N-acetyltransferase
VSTISDSITGDALLDNYVEFLRSFRGAVAETPSSVVIDSDRDDFSMMIPISEESLPALRRFEGSVLARPQLSWLDHWLWRSRLRKRTEIVFMSKPVGPMHGDGLRSIRVAQSIADIEDFSLVQSRGFIEDQREFDDWYPWLRSVNLRNQHNARCRFLIADWNGRPASVSLVFESGAACCLYAVATPREHRRQGLGTALLNASEAMARSLGYPTLGLQVYADTYAQGFYERLNFVEQYRVAVWR